MKKSLVSLFGGIVSFAALFFSYSTLCLNFAAGIPAEAQEATRQGVAALRGGDMGISFYKFVTDFSNKTIFWSTLSVILVILSVACAAALFAAGVVALIKKDETIVHKMQTKWLAILAFGFMALALIIGFVFPDFPAGQPNVFEFGATIGLGSILYLVATAGTGIIHFVKKD
ncbi:MAG: hypothetical protein FWE80_00025 [Oscillospiraceae bacterium]|nr:hypothetical protein [Oscillospiraceae bacterium]